MHTVLVSKKRDCTEFNLFLMDLTHRYFFGRPHTTEAYQFALACWPKLMEVTKEQYHFQALRAKESIQSRGTAALHLPFDMVDHFCLNFSQAEPLVHRLGKQIQAVVAVAYGLRLESAPTDPRLNTPNSTTN